MGSSSWRGHSRGAAAEVNTMGSSSWRGHSRGAAAEVNTMGSNSWSRGNWGAVGFDHTRLVLARDTSAQGCWCDIVGGCTRFTQMSCGRWDLRNIPMSAAKRELLCAVLCQHEWKWELIQPLYPEELQVPDCSCRWMKGCLELVDWTTGMEYWNGLNCCKKPFSWYDSSLESSYSLSQFTNLLYSLFRHSCLKVLGVKGHCIFHCWAP